MSKLNEIQCEKASRQACPIVNCLKAKIKELEARETEGYCDVCRDKAVERMLAAEEENRLLTLKLDACRAKKTFMAGKYKQLMKEAGDE